jgi:hypothetical protein
MVGADIEPLCIGGPPTMPDLNPSPSAEYADRHLGHQTRNLQPSQSHQQREEGALSILRDKFWFHYRQLPEKPLLSSIGWNLSRFRYRGFNSSFLAIRNEDLFVLKEF